MLNQITSQVRGIVWLTGKPLAEHPIHFQDLDYLFDGIISKKVAGEEENTQPVFEKNLFSGKSFDKDLVLIQLWGNDSTKLNKELIEALNLVPSKEDGSKIVVLGEEASKFPEKNYKAKFKMKYEILT